MTDEIILKILVLGDSAVGKTSLLLKYTDDYFPNVYVTTIGVEYKTKIIKVNGLDITLQIWDTAGQERFRSLAKTFMQGADGILFVYDITSKKSFDSIKNWIRQTEDVNDSFQKIIVGNKSDLSNKREVTKDNLNKFCSNNGKVKGIEMSAKLGENVKETFEMLVNDIVGNLTSEQIKEKFCKKEKETKNLKNINNKNNTKKKCC